MAARDLASDAPWMPCALARRDGCMGETRGVDPCRTCDACRASGAPPRVPYSLVVGRDTSPQVIVLANAALIDQPAPPAKAAA